jgi:hypothetical protein
VLTTPMSTFRTLVDIRMKFPFVRTAPSCSRLSALNLRAATGVVISPSLGGAAGCLRVCRRKCDAAGRSHQESWQSSRFLLIFRFRASAEGLVCEAEAGAPVRAGSTILRPQWSAARVPARGEAR